MKQLAPDLWAVDRPLVLGLGQDIGTRMIVIRLANGSLFLHSPVKLDEALRTDLDAQGQAAEIVCPARGHHMFAGDYVRGYPEARLWGVPGLEKKRKDLRWHALLGDETPEPWSSQLEQHLVRGVPFMNEAVFFHPATKTLVLTDLCFNVPESDRSRARLFYWISGAAGRFGPHRIIRAGIRDRAAARTSIERILRWDFTRITVTHGDVLEDNARDRFADAFAYL